MHGKSTFRMHDLSAVHLQNFWNRLASKYGTKKYWQERGEEASIVNAVSLLNLSIAITQPCSTFQAYGHTSALHT